MAERRGRAPYRACARRPSLRPGLANWHFLFLASKYRITSGTSVRAVRPIQLRLSFGLPLFHARFGQAIFLHSRPLCLFPCGCPRRPFATLPLAWSFFFFLFVYLRPTGEPEFSIPARSSPVHPSNRAVGERSVEIVHAEPIVTWPSSTAGTQLRSIVELRKM